MNTSLVAHQDEMPAPIMAPSSVMGMMALLSLMYMGGATRNLREEKEALEERVEALEEELKARDFHAHVLENDIKAYEEMFRDERPVAPAMPSNPLDRAIMDALAERKWKTAKEIVEVVTQTVAATKREVNSRLYSLKARGRVSFKEGPVPKWRK